MPDTSYEILRRTKLFDALPDAAINAIATVVLTETFPAGATIIREGEIGDRLFIIRTGVVRIYTRNPQGEETVLARLLAGNLFGEQSLASELLRRNASAWAVTEVTCLTLGRAVFHQQLQAHPSLRRWLAEQGEEQLSWKFACLPRR